MKSMSRRGTALVAVVAAVALAACGAPSTANSKGKKADLMFVQHMLAVLRSNGR